eukprot:jgi/Mesvir1/7140/Mv16260-RA.4
MLQYSGIPFPCEPEMPTQQCMGHLATTSDDKPWTTFNEYSSHLDAVCYYLQNELFHERVEGAVHHLQRGVFESIQGMAALQASAQFVDATLRQVTEAQGQLGEGQRQLSDAMQRDFKELGGLALSLGNGLQNVSAEQARLRKQHAATAQQAMRSIEGVREATHSVGLAVGTALEQQKQLLAGQQSAEEGLVRLREAQEAAFKEQVGTRGRLALRHHRGGRARPAMMSLVCGLPVSGHRSCRLSNAICSPVYSHLLVELRFAKLRSFVKLRCRSLGGDCNLSPGATATLRGACS